MDPYWYTDTSRLRVTFFAGTQARPFIQVEPQSSGEQVFRPPVGAVIDAVNDTKWVNASTTWGSAFDPTPSKRAKNSALRIHNERDK